MEVDSLRPQKGLDAGVRPNRGDAERRMSEKDGGMVTVPPASCQLLVDKSESETSPGTSPTVGPSPRPVPSDTGDRIESKTSPGTSPTVRPSPHPVPSDTSLASSRSVAQDSVDASGSQSESSSPLLPSCSTNPLLPVMLEEPGLELQARVCDLEDDLDIKAGGGDIDLEQEGGDLDPGSGGVGLEACNAGLDLCLEATALAAGDAGRGRSHSLTDRPACLRPLHPSYTHVPVEMIARLLGEVQVC
jgi:hypothetical protein